jgi:hypothetical protein
VDGKFVAIISASGSFTLRKDNGVPIPMATGRRSGGFESPAFNRLVFTDTSGSSNTVVYYAGMEPLEVSETTSALSLSAADLASITPAAVTHTCDMVDITTSVVFASKKHITILNTGATDITINCGSGARTLAPGDSVTFPVLRIQDSLPSITVDATGGSARVTWLA